MSNVMVVAAIVTARNSKDNFERKMRLELKCTEIDHTAVGQSNAVGQVLTLVNRAGYDAGFRILNWIRKDGALLSSGGYEIA